MTLAATSRCSTAFMTGGPMILLTGHYGNWEMAGYLFGMFGFPPTRWPGRSITLTSRSSSARFANEPVRG